MKLKAATVFLIGLLAVGYFYQSTQSGATRLPSGELSELGGPTFKDLKSDILANKIKSSQDLLHFFASNSKYQGLTRNAILERRSFALHDDQVTDEFPRIVMSDGNLTLHLTSDTPRLGDRLIELIEYDPKAADFNFKLISFGSKTGEPEFFETPADGNLPRARLNTETGGSVQNCSNCHTNGADGGFENLHWGPLDGLGRVYGTGRDLIEKNSDEFKSFQKFLNVKNDPARGVLFQDLGLKISSDNSGNIVFPDSPNQHFTEHVYETARRKMAASIRKFSGYREYQYSVAAALLNCQDLDQFLPLNSKTEHEFWLRKLLANGNVSNSYYIDVTRLKKSDMRDSFWADPKHPERALQESGFFEDTTLSLIPALGIFLSQTNDEVASIMARNYTGDDAKKYLANQAIYLEESYISRMAKLRYLFFGYFPEVPSDIFAPVNEVISVRGGGAARQSYRLLGGNRFFDLLLSNNFGPMFLKANPDLNYFRGDVMSVENLKVPVQQYCGRLKEKSLAGFTRNPLNQNPQGGLNGDLCAADLGHCRYPLACVDRGDGTKACTGGDSRTGKPGDLCAGPMGSAFFCKAESSCADRGDGILKCTQLPDGSGVLGDQCNLTNTKFCGPGLFCKQVPGGTICSKSGDDE